jgi:hypothetical protein
VGRFTRAGRAALIALSCVALSSLQSQAACVAYTVGSAQYVIKQSNGYTVSCTLISHGNGPNFQGDCRVGSQGGFASGEIRGRAFTLRILWGTKSHGRYTGTIADGGWIEDGRTYDVLSPSNWAIWWLDYGRLGCQ